MKHSLSTSSINKANLCAAGIKVHLPIIVLHIHYFKIPKSILYIEKFATSQQITPNMIVIS